MKALILHIFLLIAVLTLSSPALAEDPVDLVALQELGLSPEIIGRYLAQNLDSTRVAPPIEAGLISRLGEYGGDELVGSYLNLDKQTAHLQRRDFSPQVVEQLLAGDVGADKLKKVLDDEASAAARAAAEVPAPAAVPALPAPEVTESELSPPPAAVEAVPPAPTIPPVPLQAVSVPEPPVLAAPASSAPSAPQAVLPAIPQAAAPAAPQGSAPVVQAPVVPTTVAPQVAAPVVQAPPAPAPQRRFQDLRPGQAADPASKLPPPLDTYEIRQPAAGGGPVMGVTERELADGHRVEVNILGDPAMVGQEVITRPSGRKVYRYHSGNTGRPAPISDPAQERRNREDLQIIHGGSK